MDHKKKELQKIFIEISTLKKDHEKNLGMEFIDSDDRYFYMLGKEYDANQNTITQTLYTLDINGKLEQTHSLPFALDYNPSVAEEQKRVDGKFSQNQNAGMYPSKSLAVQLTYFDNALCHVKLDLKHGYLYSYGAEYNGGPGSKKASNAGISPTHMFIHQFNLETEELKASFRMKVPEQFSNQVIKYTNITTPLKLNLTPLDSESVALTIQGLTQLIVCNTNFQEAEINERKPLEVKFMAVNSNYYAAIADIEQFQATFYYYKHLLPKPLVEYYKTCEGLTQYPKVMQAIYTGDAFITIFNDKKAIETHVFPINKK